MYRGDWEIYIYLTLMTLHWFEYRQVREQVVIDKLCETHTKLSFLSDG